ncbi:hypothetical protein KVT40_001960 [Elsinoe batatas]|uniref:Uncharacterized protein n=1 Tax=Elsinoe batatas TaxID=2601811 RepID=A0A8K0L5L5_9PEZI|nr:hypothetical protein KVT40_001960 [Elsinoe batatas]
MARYMLAALLFSPILATPITDPPALPTPVVKRTGDTLDAGQLVDAIQSSVEAAISTTLDSAFLSSLVVEYKLTEIPTALLSGIIASATANPSAIGDIEKGLDGLDLAGLTSLLPTPTPAPGGGAGIMASHPDLYTPDGPKGPVGDRPGFGPDNADSNGVYLEGGDCDLADEAAEASNGGVAVSTTTTDSGPLATPGANSPTDGNGDGVAADGSLSTGPKVVIGGEPTTPGTAGTAGGADDIDTTTPDGAPGGLRGGPGSEECAPETITVTVTSPVAGSTGTADTGSTGTDSTSPLTPKTDPLDGLATDGSASTDPNITPGSISAPGPGENATITGPSVNIPPVIGPDGNQVPGTGSTVSGGSINVPADGSEPVLTRPTTSWDNPESAGASDDDTSPVTGSESPSGSGTGNDADTGSEPGDGLIPGDPLSTPTSGPGQSAPLPTGSFGSASGSGAGSGSGSVGQGNVGGPLRPGNSTGTFTTSSRGGAVPTGTGPTASSGTKFPFVGAAGRKEVNWGWVLVLLGGVGGGW